MIYNDFFQNVKIDDNSLTAVITDPPYGIKYLNNKWDYSVPSIEDFKILLSKLKPGGNIFCFGGTRTFHRMIVNMEDAGFNIDNTIAWIYQPGMPKSVDISYQIDKRDNTFGETVEISKRSKGIYGNKTEIKITKPGSFDSQKWYGWLTGLSPAWEPIIVAHKPIEGNWCDNATKYGVAGFNIDDCRVPTNKKLKSIKRRKDGRYPSNVIIDEDINAYFTTIKKDFDFFFCPKPSKQERGGFKHPTMKPVELMKYLVTLSKMPENNLILDPYMGSGTTGIACKALQVPFIGIESSKEYFEIAKKRIENYE